MLAGGSQRSLWDGPSLHTPRPHLHPGGALTRHGGGRCAGLPGSSGPTSPHVRARPPPGPLPAVASPARLSRGPPAPSRRDRGRCGPSLTPFSEARTQERRGAEGRGREGGRRPGLLPGPHCESQRAAPPRASAAEPVPAGSWSPQRPRCSHSPTGGCRPPARGPPTAPAPAPAPRGSGAPSSRPAAPSGVPGTGESSGRGVRSLTSGQRAGGRRCGLGTCGSARAPLPTGVWRPVSRVCLKQQPAAATHGPRSPAATQTGVRAPQMSKNHGVCQRRAVSTTLAFREPTDSHKDASWGWGGGVKSTHSDRRTDTHIPPPLESGRRAAPRRAMWKQATACGSWSGEEWVCFSWGANWPEVK